MRRLKSDNLSGAQRSALLYCLNHGEISTSTYGSRSGVNDGYGDLHELGRVTDATIKALCIRLGYLKLEKTKTGYDSIPAGPFGRTYREGYRSILTGESVFKLTDAGRAAAEGLKPDLNHEKPEGVTMTTMTMPVIAPEFEFRCTRNALYHHPCLGRDDLSARQGHYVTAESREAALVEMRRRFPEDWVDSPPDVAFTAQTRDEVEAANEARRELRDRERITPAIAGGE